MFHICFAANENYVKYTAVLITSIIKSIDTSKKFKDFFEIKIADNANGVLNESSLAKFKKLDYNSLSQDEQSEGFIFHILSDFVSYSLREKLSNLAKELSQIYPCEIHIHIAKDEIFQGLQKLSGNYLTYFRILIKDFMPQSVKSCLYLDVDMLVRGDLRELWTLNLTDKIAGVVKDLPNFTLHILHSKNSQNDDICFNADDFYFNAGAMLINLDEWQRQQIKQKTFDCMLNYKLQRHDQDALNAVIQKEQTLTLPFEYNLLVESYLRAKSTKQFSFRYSKQEVEFALSNPVILHFSGCYNAWSGVPFVDNEGKNLGLYWWDMARQTPFFAAELKVQFEKSVDNYLIYTKFGFFIALLVSECSKSFLGYIKMPFVVWRAFKEFDVAKSDDYKVNSNENLDKSLAFEFLYIATKAWVKRKKGKLIFLPLKIYKTKKHYTQGKLKAQAKSICYELYVGK